MKTREPASTLPLPERLVALIEAKRWPLNHEADARMQNREPIPCPPQWDSSEGLAVHLLAPPFRTIAERPGEHDFWTTWCAPSEISFELAIPIGDLGLGSDAPIILDYQLDRSSPRVRLLKWGNGNDGSNNHWIDVGHSFDDFCEVLKLDAIDWDAKRKRYATAQARFEQRQAQPWWKFW